MKSCEQCGAPFNCGNSGKSKSSPEACWCQKLPSAQDIPQKYQDCLCPKCLGSFMPPPPELTGTDYYMNEQGLMVFTESYHLKRGYCCNSNCKHCPY